MPTVIGIADSDSYLKWTAATLASLPADWRRLLVLVRSPVQPSPRQIRAAVGDGPGSGDVNGVMAVEVRSWPSLLRRIASVDPELIVLGCTGPVVELLAASPVVRSPNRILITGLPGLSLPASSKAVRARRGCDVLVVHSRRERAEFSALAAVEAPELRVALARLPFLHSDPGESGNRTAELVFAAQAQVPPEREQRRAVLAALAEVTPPWRPVVKLRALTGEHQTHTERWPYDELWRELAAERDWSPERIAFSDESMGTVLRRAGGLVTVSSTAALEAMARGVETVVLRDFGVSAELINLAYADSGCLGTLGDVAAGRLREADPAWLADHCLHPADEDDLVATLQELLASPRRTRAGRPPIRRLARSAARLLLPSALRPVVRSGVQRVRALRTRSQSSRTAP